MAPSEPDLAQGLSDAQARDRLARDGFNELAAQRSHPAWRMLLGVLREPMFLLLLACAALYALVGDLQEALVLGTFIAVVIVVTVVQEWRTESAVAALRQLSSPRALVLRAGQAVRVPGRDVVVGDVLVLSEGDRIAADGAIAETSDLLVDESLLTGESAAVRKEAGGPAAGPSASVYAGSLVLRGRALVRVTATGSRTALGRIGASLQHVPTQPTRMQQEMARLVRRFSVLALGLCVALTLLYGALRGDWLGGLLSGLTLAMALLPEEFPVILTVFLAMGAWRMSRLQVLVRRIPALEALGAVTVLCVDKTGTLTENRMQVRGLWVPGETTQPGERWAVPEDASTVLPEAFHALLETAALAGPHDPLDPIDVGVHQFASRMLAGTEHLHLDWLAERQYPLSSALLATSQVYRPPGQAVARVAAKGAPEAIMDLCHLPSAEAATVQQAVTAMAQDGLRVIAVAVADHRPAALPAGQHDFAFRLVGLLGFQDPLRPAVPTAVAECRAAGIRVLMLTGDHPDTALVIARQAGLLDGLPAAARPVLTGAALQSMDDHALRAALDPVHGARIFARVMPEQKLRLVQALQAEGHVVAMTGDGVNDAPALKRADIGIAMGQRGTDVAREAAALVLADDNFASIVAAVRQGRRIFANIRKASTYVVAIHLPIAGLTLVPVLLGWPLVLLPFHVACLHMLIDPSCSTVLEAEPAGEEQMRVAPRSPSQHILDRDTVLWGLFQGGVALLASLGLFGLTWLREANEASARTLGFSTLLLLNVALVMANRSRQHSLWQILRTPNRPALWVTAGAAAFLSAVFSVPGLRDLFRMAALRPGDAVQVAGAVLAAMAVIECVRWWRHAGPGAPGNGR